MQGQISATLRQGRSALFVGLIRNMTGRAPVLAALVMGALLVCFAPAAQAQFRASLSGTVTDPSGALIPGATVTLVDTATNYTQTATSNASGIYTFNALPPAPYRLTVTKEGFKTKVLEHVQIIPEQENGLNLQLEVGGAAQTVTVSGVTQGLETQTATESATLSSDEIQHMPSFDRDVFQLAQLTPGVFGNAAQGSGGGSYNNPGNQGPGGSGAGGIFNTENGPQVQDRGGQYETNGISVDGISTVSAVWGGTSVVTPSEDSVQDMHVVANSYDAEDGRFSGAQMEIISKSGTNAVHGSAFFKASRPGLDAFQRWNGVGSNIAGTGSTNVARAASRGVNRDDERTDNYGASLGGPLWKNRLFAFFNFEASPNSGINTSQGWYETSQFDSGAGPGPIARKYLSFTGEGVAPGATMIARTCSSIALSEGVNCNTETGGLDVGSPMTTGVGYQDLTYGGKTSTPGVGGGLDGVPDIAYFNTADPSNTSQIQYNGRLDADLTQKDRLTFAIYWVPVTSTDYNGPVRAANLWHHSQVNDAFSLIWNHTFSPTLLNQARANAAGWRWNEIATNPQEPFGLPQDNIDQIGTASVNFFGAPGPSDFDQWTDSYNDVLTKVLGKQNIKVGGDVTRLSYLNSATYAARPGYNFHNLWDFANDAPYFESGEFNSKTGIPFSNREDNRDSVWGFFAQDDYKILPNLTINAGLRWSYFSPYYSKENNLDVVQFGTGTSALTGMNIRVGGNLASTDKNNWGPQLGFAWQPLGTHGKGVLRGGFGINYNQDEIAILANGYGNPPNAINANYNCGYPYTANPTCSGTGIVYAVGNTTTSLFNYPPNPNAITTFSSANLPLTGTTGVTAFPAHTKTITNYHYSLEADYQMPYSTVATLSYQGSELRHLIVQNIWNAVAAQAGIPQNPAVNFIDYYENAGNGNYNAMVATLTHNFSHHYQAEAMYTWAKSMDENSGPYSEDPYPYDIHAAYGRSDYNVANAFKLFGLWQPVFFSGHSWAEKVAGGWALSGIWNVDSGFPWNPTYGSNGVYMQGTYYSLRPAGIIKGFGTSTANKNFEGRGPGQTNPNFGGNGTKYFVAPTYVQAPSFPNTAPGPMPGIQRNSMNGPGYNDLDASLTKAFGLPENRILGNNSNLSFRVDTYNLFNKTNLNTGCMDTYLGGVNPDGTVSSVNSDFGNVCGALGSRTVQLQTRFSF